MSEEESAEVRQNNEFEALKSIYPESVKDNRKKAAWNRWTPLDLILSLQPQQGNSGTHKVHATVDLHIICPETYPITGIPEIRLENTKGLSDNLLFDLKTTLEKEAVELAGAEMIFELTQIVQEFLHTHNKPLLGSLHERMETTNRLKSEKELQAKREAEDLEREKIKKEVQKREEMLKNEERLVRGSRYNSETSTDDTGMGLYSLSNSSPDDSNDCLCNYKNTVLIEFSNRQVHRGRCLRHCSSNHTVFIAIDAQTGEILLLSEWIIGNDKQLPNLEQEFNYLSKLRQPNLVHFLNLKCESQSNGNTVVYITKEYINGPNCTYFINKKFNPTMQFIKYISMGVLTALDYLHRKNVVHKDIRDGCVYINEAGTVLLSNYSLHRRLTDLCSSSSSNLDSNFNKKTDIYDFGLFLKSLLLGEKNKGEDVDIPAHIFVDTPLDFSDFLSKCLASHEKERFTASQLLNHPFITQLGPLPSPRHRNDANDLNRNISPDFIPYELTSMPQGQSRIAQEFAFLSYLGRGAFGDVRKFRNKLDGRAYAIKSIKLNPKNRQLNKKIVREAQLLSRLNHENIVRYYNCWYDEDLDESRPSSSDGYDRAPKVAVYDEFSINDNIEELAPAVNNFEPSLTYNSALQPAFDSSLDVESSDDEDSWGTKIEEDSSSESIQFKRDDNEPSVTEQSITSTTSLQSKASSNENRGTRYLFIQMEFCEKSTLQNAIDDGVNCDEARLWRLFREIVEGLVHVHQQGIIHRDLKPVNIFLDAHDHVKIGDFGLATNIKTKLNDSPLNRTLQIENEETMDESKTGQIGTALYVAPELGSASKANYNQKVDIYSLGIIFFEMSYGPLKTKAERFELITKLRTKNIILPQPFAKEHSKQATLIKWLLNHDATKRPTSQELLQSEHVPPPVLQECQLRELVRHTLSNTQLKNYKHLIASCFDQKLPEAQDVTYDRDPSGSSVNKPLELYEYVKSIIIKIFKQHGGRNLSTPLLMPRSQYLKNTETYVKLMTHFGGIVSLPHDLRVPFARYVAWNNVHLLRRYSIERVYRERKVFGFVPRELCECAFDIVTPTPGNLMMDAELLYMFLEIVNEVPGLKNKPITLGLNHSKLSKAILLHFGIKEKHQEVLQMVLDTKEGKIPKTDLYNFLNSFGLSENSMSTLTNFFVSEYEVSKAEHNLQMLLRKREGEVFTLTTQALKDLKCIVSNAEAFGVTFPIVIAPGAINNVSQYSGVIFQFVCEIRKKNKPGGKAVLAAGGRYDGMIQSYRQMSGQDIQQSAAVGISVSLEKLILLTRGNDALPKFASFDVAVSSVSAKPKIQEKTKMLRDLWSVGIRAVLVESTTNADIQEQCTELKIPHIIMLKDNDQGLLPVRIWERDRYQDKSFKTGELIDNLQRLIKNRREGSHDLALSMTTTSRESKDYNSDMKIDYVRDGRSVATRKKLEMQIKKELNYLSKKLSGITVLVIDLNAESIRTISAYLEYGNEQQFNKSLLVVTEKHPRHASHVEEICRAFYEHKTRKANSPIVLYNITDRFHRLII